MTGTSTAKQLTLENLTVRPTGGTWFYGVTVDDAAVQLTNVTLEGCGTGLVAIGSGSSAAVFATMTNSRIINGIGQGIQAGGLVLTITGSTISGNRDGGVRYGGHGGQHGLWITGSTISNNDQGGIIYNRGDATGGDAQSFQITTSAITGNTGSGGIQYYGDSAYQMRISRSLIANNSATWNGGGIYSSGQTHIHNSTIANNVSDTEGGGIYHEGAEFYLWNVTVAGNSSGGRGGGVFWLGSQGGVEYSIIANNSGATLGGTVSKDIHFGPTSGFTKIYNLIGTINGFESQFSDSSNRVGTLSSPLNPRLLALANNGGPTQTMALLSSSPARDRIPAAGYVNPSGQTPVVDQRGTVRPRNGLYDMGAYER